MNRMGMFMRVVGTFTLALGLAAAMPAQAQNRCTTTTLDLTFMQLLNPCNGESIVLTSGTQTITSCLVDDKHMTFRVTTHATGMGDQGNTYVADSHWNFTQTANAQGLFEFNASFDDKFFSNGSASNFIRHCSAHITATPSGQIYVESFGCTVRCIR